MKVAVGLSALGDMGLLGSGVSCSDFVFAGELTALGVIDLSRFVVWPFCLLVRVVVWDEETVLLRVLLVRFSKAGGRPAFRRSRSLPSVSLSKD